MIISNILKSYIKTFNKVNARKCNYILGTKPVTPNINFSGLKLSMNADSFKATTYKSQLLKLLGNRKLNITTIEDAQPFTKSFIQTSSFNGTMNIINDEFKRYGTTSPEITKLVNKIDEELLENIPRTTADVICYKGKSYSLKPILRGPLKGKLQPRAQEYLNLKIGDTITSKSYPYYTDNIDYAEHFIELNSGDLKILHVSLLPKGSHGILHTAEKGSLILPRNTKEKVIDIRRDGDKCIIYSEIITP